MDISKASNLERFVYDLVARDGARVKQLWRELDDTGRFDLSVDQARFAEEFGIVSGTSTHADRLRVIAEVAAESGVIIDPHTADGVRVAREHGEAGVPMLVLETAKPQKFAETVTEALGKPAPLTKEMEKMLDLPQRTAEIPDDENVLRDYIAAHFVTG